MKQKNTILRTFRKSACAFAALQLLAVSALQAAPPNAPSNLIARTIYNNRIDITWKDNSTDETGFLVERKMKNGSWATVATVAADVKTHASTALYSGQLYYFRVKALKGTESSAFSSEATAITTGGTAPSAPPLMYGVNLACAEFGSVVPGTYNTHYTYPTNPAEWDYYNGKGLKLIRLPFKWERVQRTLNGELDAAEMQRMDTVITLARSRGMKVILDMHNYDRRSVSGTSYLIGSAEVPNSAFRDVWARIATRYASETAIWAYGLMNEPHDTNGTWPATAQEGVNGVRSADSTHFILIAGDGFSGAQRWDTANPNILSVLDPRNKLIYEAHCYFDNDASGRYDANYATEGGYPNIGVDRVKVFTDWLARNNNRQGFIGEYGIPGNVDSAAWNTVLNNFLTFIKSKGVSGTYWAGGPWWNTYPLSCEPTNSFTTDKPQMVILQTFN